MSIRVQLPPVLRAVTGGARQLDAEGQSIAAALSDLARKHPALALHLFDEAGAVRRHVVCLHDSAVVRAADMRSCAIRADDEIIITNALAGG